MDEGACRSALLAEAKATAVAQKATVAVLAIRATLLLHFFRHDVDVDIILFVVDNNLTGVQIHQTVLRLYRRPFPFRVDSNYLWRGGRAVERLGAACLPLLFARASKMKMRVATTVVNLYLISAQRRDRYALPLTILWAFL